MADDGDDFFLRDWVRKQLEAGDNPEVLKTVLKNRGMDVHIVDSVLSSIKKNPKAEKTESLRVEPKKTFVDLTLRKDVEKILSSKHCDEEEDEKPVKTAQQPESHFAFAKHRSLAEPGRKPLKEDKIYGAGVKTEICGAEEKTEKTPAKAEIKISEPQQKTVQAEHNPEPAPKSLFALFLERVKDYFSGIKFSSPKISEYIFDTRIVLLTGIAVAILIIALLLSFSLDWYADKLAKNVLS